MKFQFVLCNDDESFGIATVDWPRIPRVGEAVALDGIVSANDRARLVAGEAKLADVTKYNGVFKVVEVFYQGDDEDPCACAVSVWLTLRDPIAPTWAVRS